MKVTIRKRFRDAETGKLMLPGSHADYEQARAMKLTRSGFVQMDESVQNVEVPAPESDEDKEVEQPDPDTSQQDMEAEEDEKEKVEVPAPTKNETAGIPGKRGRKPKK